MKYKVTNIVYSTDGVKVDLPTEMVVECEGEDRIADAISDKTGWLVESFRIEKQSERIVEMLMQVREETKSAIMQILTERKVESINVQPYIQEDYITNYAFFDTDKNGNGECLELDAIKKDGESYSFTMYTNYGDYFCVKEFGEFDTSELVYILEMLEEIFECVDEGEPLLKDGEDFDDYEEDSREEESKERPWDYEK